MQSNEVGGLRHVTVHQAKFNLLWKTDDLFLVTPAAACYSQSTAVPQQTNTGCDTP